MYSVPINPLVFEHTACCNLPTKVSEVHLEVAEDGDGDLEAGELLPGHGAEPGGDCAANLQISKHGDISQYFWLLAATKTWGHFSVFLAPPRHLESFMAEVMAYSLSPWCSSISLKVPMQPGIKALKRSYISTYAVPFVSLSTWKSRLKDVFKINIP